MKAPTKIVRKAKTKIAFFVFRRNKFLLAAVLSAYSVFVSLIAAIFVSAVRFSDPSPIVRWCKVGVAIVALLSVCFEVYFNFKTYKLRNQVFLKKLPNRHLYK